MRVTSAGFAMMFFAELIFMFYTLGAFLYYDIPYPTSAQQYEAALRLVRVDEV
jgi:hypothetical protein